MCRKEIDLIRDNAYACIFVLKTFKILDQYKILSQDRPFV